MSTWPQVEPPTTYAASTSRPNPTTRTSTYENVKSEADHAASATTVTAVTADQ